MFYDASVFNQDISNWDVSGVNNMINMFYGADALSQQNQCAIHTSFSTNQVWPYDWSSNCPTPFQPQTKADLQTAVNLWVSDEASALSQYGDINTWDVSLVTDMESLLTIRQHLTVTLAIGMFRM